MSAAPSIVQVDMLLVELEGWVEVLSFLALSKDDVSTGALSVLAGRLSVLLDEMRTATGLGQQREASPCA